MGLNLERDGAQWLGPLPEAPLVALEAQLPASRAGGIRLAGLPWLDRWLTDHLQAVLNIAGLESGRRPVRAILFDKTDAANWALGWHQDRTVAVRANVDAPGYGPWSSKQGLLHVEPPFTVLADMLTVRLHLDPVDADNAPLRVALGSHRLGRIADAEVEPAVAACETFTCLAGRGDLWAYATPILHASSASIRPRRRRVLQVDLARGQLPGGVEWLGLA